MPLFAKIAEKIKHYCLLLGDLLKELIGTFFPEAVSITATQLTNMSFDEILDLTADVFFILWYSTYMFSGLDRYYAEDSARDLSQRQV